MIDLVLYKELHGGENGIEDVQIEGESLGE
jgi:hypothetical protein